MAQQKLSRYFFAGLLLGATLLFFELLSPFLLAIFLAAVFCTLFYPTFGRLTRALKGRKMLASFLTCLMLLVGLVVPVYGIAQLVVEEAISFYNTAETRVKEVLAEGEAGPLGQLRRMQVVRALDLDHIDWKAHLQEIANTAGGVLTSAVGAASSGTIKVVVTLFITLFTMFYFFVDGEALVRRVKELVPLDSRHEDAIIARFSAVARATLRGTLLIALAQGTLTGLTLWIFGVGAPFLWGMVATLTSIIPMLGAGIVLYPAAAIQMATGHVGAGIAIAAISFLVVHQVDNVLRVKLVGQEAGLHDLMVFFSTLGGIDLFGPMGFLVGPIVAALFLSLLDIYSREFKDDLEASRGRGKPPAADAPAAPAVPTEAPALP